MFKEGLFALSLLQAPSAPAIQEAPEAPFVVSPTCPDGHPGLFVEVNDNQRVKRELHLHNLRTGQSFLAMTNFELGEPASAFTYAPTGEPISSNNEVMETKVGDQVKVDVVTQPGGITSYSRTLTLTCAPNQVR